MMSDINDGIVFKILICLFVCLFVGWLMFLLFWFCESNILLCSPDYPCMCGSPTSAFHVEIDICCPAELNSVTHVYIKEKKI